MKRVDRGSAGVSVLEVVIGLSVFVVALLLVFAYFPTAKRSAVVGRDTATAQSLAREILERERALPYADVGQLSAAAVNPPERLPITSVTNGQEVTTEFLVSMDVTEIDPGKVKDIVVTVRWFEGQLEHKVVLETYKVRYPGLVGS